MHMQVKPQPYPLQDDLVRRQHHPLIADVSLVPLIADVSLVPLIADISLVPLLSQHANASLVLLPRMAA